MHLGIVGYMLLYLRCLDTFGYIWVLMDIRGHMWCIYIYLYLYVYIGMYIMSTYIPIYNTQLKRVHVYRCIYVYTGYIYIYVETERCAWIYTDVFETWLHMSYICEYTCG